MVKRRDQPVERQWLGRPTQLLETRCEYKREGVRVVWRLYHHPDRRWVGRPTGPDSFAWNLWLDPSVVRVETSVYRGNAKRSHVQHLIELHPEPVVREVAGQRVECYLETTVTLVRSERGSAKGYQRRWLSPEVPGLVVYRETRRGGPDGRIGLIQEVIAFGPIEELREMDTRPVVLQQD
ncbi:MAG: hypothetical protein AAGI68_16330 [Planctomycetota bacterium]